MFFATRRDENLDETAHKILFCQKPSTIRYSNRGLSCIHCLKKGKELTES